MKRSLSDIILRGYNFNYPLIPSRWLIKKNIEIGTEKLKELKNLERRLKRGEKIKLHKLKSTGTVMIFPREKDVRKERMFYQEYIPRLKKRLEKMI
jgi:hypothetical protein